MTALSGPLADDLWRIGHEDATGRLWVDAAGMSLGLAAGLLGELWLGGHVRIGHGRLEVAAGQPLPRDDVTGSVLRLLARETTDFTLPSWLAFLARDSYQQVAKRMAAAGHIQRQRRHLTGSAWLATARLARCDRSCICVTSRVPGVPEPVKIFWTLSC